MAKKVKQILSNTLRLNFWYLKIIGILHPRYNPKIIGHVLKKSQKNKYVCIHETMRLIIIKIKIKMKNRSYRYDISRPSKHLLVFKTSSRYVFKTSSTRLQRNNLSSSKTSSRRLDDVLKTSCKQVSKTSSRRLQDVLRDIFKTY